MLTGRAQHRPNRAAYLWTMVSRTVVRFLAVGACNTGIDVVLFWVLHAPLGVVLANVVSTTAGMTFSFLVNGRHTFGAERVTVRQAVLFVGSNALTMWVLQPALIVVVAQSATGVPLMGAKVLALGGSVVANFLLYRYLVWAPGSVEVRTSTLPAGPSAAPEATRR
jgi:putative flippase GtrA